MKRQKIIICTYGTYKGSIHILLTKLKNSFVLQTTQTVLCRNVYYRDARNDTQ